MSGKKKEFAHQGTYRSKSFESNIVFFQSHGLVWLAVEWPDRVAHYKDVGVWMVQQIVTQGLEYRRRLDR